MENTHITQRLFPWKPKSGKPTYSIFIHTIHFLQYNIHIGDNGIQNPNQLLGLVNNPISLTGNRKPSTKNHVPKNRPTMDTENKEKRRHISRGKNKFSRALSPPSTPDTM
jgi:hypothetical protein